MYVCPGGGSVARSACLLHGSSPCSNKMQDAKCLHAWHACHIAACVRICSMHARVGLRTHETCARRTLHRHACGSRRTCMHACAAGPAAAAGRRQAKAADAAGAAAGRGHRSSSSRHRSRVQPAVFQGRARGQHQHAGRARGRGRRRVAALRPLQAGQQVRPVPPQLTPTHICERAPCCGPATPRDALPW